MSKMNIPESNGKTVLVTGINGFIASVLGKLLLSKGYSVRGTTRRIESSDSLLKGPYSDYQDRVKIYQVSDMTVSGAFDEAAKGVDGIFHTASPVDFSLDSYDAMVTPAVKGSETLLESALKAGPNLISVVVTSSTVAIINPTEIPGHVFTEREFASVALEKAIKDKKDGVKSTVAVLYAASKIAADRAVWKFRDEHKPSFSISSINPVVVVGPPVVLPENGDKLNETLKPVYRLLSGKAREIEANIGSGSFVDVRDVATMHLWAFENAAKSDGERYIASQGFGPVQAAADILHEKYKGREIGQGIVVGHPGEGYLGYNKETEIVEDVRFPPKNYRFSGGKAEREMGIKWISFKQSVSQTADVLEALL